MLNGIIIFLMCYVCILETNSGPLCQIQFTVYTSTKCHELDIYRGPGLVYQFHFTF